MISLYVYRFLLVIGLIVGVIFAAGLLAVDWVKGRLHTWKAIYASPHQ